MAFEGPRRYLQPEVFEWGEQGLLNFILMREHQAGVLTLRRVPFMRWSPCMSEDEVDLSLLRPQSPYRFVMHGAGYKDYTPETAPMSKVLGHFSRIYEQRASGIL